MEIGDLWKSLFYGTSLARFNGEWSRHIIIIIITIIAHPDTNPKECILISIFIPLIIVIYSFSIKNWVQLNNKCR